MTDTPFRAYICHCADVILASQHKFVVQCPLGFVVQDGGRVQVDQLVVFDCHVMPTSFQMGNLTNFDQNTANRPVDEAAETCMKKPATRAFLMFT